MVFRHIRRRHNDRRLAQNAQLAQRCCTGAANHKICCRHDICHIIDILAQFNVRMLVQIHALFLDAVRQPLVRSGARRMNMPEAVVLALQLNKACHVPIHIQSAQAAPERNDQPRHDVRLMHRRRDARLCTVAHERIARIAAAAHDNIRLIFAQNLLCLCGRSQRLLQCGNVVQHRRRRHRTLEAAHVHGIQLIALTRHQLGFNARRCSGEANFYIIAAGLCIFRNGKTRIDMAARAAACNKQFHIKLPLFSSSLFFGWRNVS